MNNVQCQPTSAIPQRSPGEIDRGLPAGSPLLTAQEAASFLRFDAEGRDLEQAVRSLNRLVEQRKIRPCPLGGRNRFSIRELNRFIDQRTEESA